MDASSFVDTASQPASAATGVAFDGTGSNGPPARDDQQLETDELVNRLNDYTAATSVTHLRAIAADVLLAWEHSLVTGDSVGVSRLIALSHAIRAAGNDHEVGMIG